VQSVIFGSSNLQKSIDYWHGTLGLQLHSKDDKSAVISFGGKQAKIELREIGKSFNDAHSYI
jgi:catechol 2,3-dioxygenase-like lactoylglutathione lyase family enzyme